MGNTTKLSVITPLIFESKLLCLSLLYLITTVFLALHTFVSPTTKCLFRSSPFDPIQSTLFSYPPNYGEHKYAIPTHRNSCSSPVLFSDYWVVVKEMQDLYKNSTELGSSRSGLRYLNGKFETFGGNFTTQKRTYYHSVEDDVEIPCGFFKKFPVSNSDQIVMERCEGLVVVSAIFNDHDKIRQPKGLGTNTIQNVCFFMFVDDTTLKGLDHHQLISRKPHEHYNVGVWRIIKVSSKDLYDSPAMNGIIPKYLVHRLFPNSKYSIWVDAKLQLMVDPLLLAHALVVSKDADMAISKHPFFIHTMEEAVATARWKKWWNVNALRLQMETYCENGLSPWSLNKLPYPSDVPDSALVIRKHGKRSNLFSCLMFNELEAFNPRDQLAFAYIRDKMRPKLKLNMFEVEVFEQVALEYRHNLKKEGASTSSGSAKNNRRVSFTNDLFFNDTCCSKCKKYLFEMWGESHY